MAQPLDKSAVSILNVDGNAPARYARRQILTRAGFDVHDACTGSDALRLFDEIRPDIVLLGVRLPGLDAFEVCRRIRESRRGEQVVIVHVSAEASGAHSQVTSLESGADACIIEPSYPGVLAATIRALLRARRSEFRERAARNELASVAERLDTALEATSDSVIRLDRNWRITYINRRARLAVGLNRDLIGWNFYDAFPEQPEASFHAEYRRVFQTGVASRFQAYYPPLAAWFEVNAEPDGDGLLLFFRDITEWKRRELEREQLIESLRRSEAQALRNLVELEAVYHSAPIGLAVLDRDLRYVRVNERFAAMNGAPVDAHIGRTVREIAPELAGAARTAFERILETGEPVLDLEVAAVTPAQPGVRRSWTQQWVPLRDESGRIAGVSMAVEETTARKRIEHALRESEQRYRAVFEYAALGVCRVAFEGARWIDVNEAFCRMLGYTREEILSRPWPEITHPDDVDLDLIPFRKMARGELDTYTVEKRFIHKQGRHVWSCLTLSLVRDASGRPDYEIAIIEDITPRKQAEAALRESEERFRTLADNIAQFAWMADANGWIFWYNRRWYEYTGTTLEQMQGWGWRTVHHPDHAERVAARIARCFETGEVWEDIFPLRGKNGEYRWFLSRAIPIRDENGRVVRWFGTNTDVTRQRENEERLRATFENAGVGILESDGERIVLANDRACDILGRTREQLLGMTIRELTHAGDRERSDFLNNSVANGGVPRFVNEKRYIRGDGSQVWARTTVSAIRAPDGRFVRSIAVIEDISEQKAFEQALRESEEKLRLALDAAGLGTWKYTFDGDVWELDDRARALYNAPSNLLKHGGSPLAVLLHPEDVPGTWDRICQACDPAGEGKYEAQHRVLGANGGTERWLAAWGRVEFEGEGPARKAVRMVGASRDITEQKRREESLVETQKLESIGVLAGGIAHDFNNLLTGIMGSISLVAESMPPGARERSLLDAAIKASERAANLTRQLLAYAGKGRFVLERVDVSALIRESRQLINSSIPKNVHVEMDLAAGLPPVEGDPAQLRQLVMNLVVNGAEAIPENQPGAVWIRTGVEPAPAAPPAAGPQPSAGGPSVFIEVTDNGIGMEEAVQARIFDPFFTTKFTGRGLGLAAVSGIVRSHHGNLTVKSAPGRGATFRLQLPACEQPAPRAPAGPDAPAGRGGGIVLVVDDEQEIRNVAREALERRGFKVLTAENGLEAIHLLELHRNRIDAVLLDFAMPVMNGPQTLSVLREKAPQLKVLLTSGYSEADAVRMFRYTGASAFIQKPYTAAALAEKIAEIVAPAANRPSPRE